MSQLKLVNPCGSCVLVGDSCGFVPASGTGDNGVLLIGEAAGESEAAQSEGFVGKAGLYLFSQLQRAGVEREGFRIANVLSCRPPDNQLAKMPYEAEAIATCAPLLDATIDTHVKHCGEIGKTPVIVTLGRIAFKRVMGLSERSPIMKEDYGGYVHWAERYGCYVLAADHPSYLMRGNHHLAPVLQWTVKRALEVASDGFSYEEPTYILDPEPAVFQQWVKDARAACTTDPEGFFLSFDIETPYKKGKSEDDIASAEDESFTILRCSFAYNVNQAVSVPWTADYLPMIAELFDLNGYIFGHNNNGYDDERVMAQVPIRGTILDAMIAWHVLNSTLPKGLGFVTPFYAPRFKMWKHLNHEAPALYNAIDALAALRNWIGIREGLKSAGLWNVYDRHVLQLNKALSYMSQKGLKRDETFRDECEAKLSQMLEELDARIQGVIPDAARKFKVYKKTPSVTEGLVEIRKRSLVPRCSVCGVNKPLKPHFKEKKRSVNPCAAGHVVESEEMVLRWARPVEWKISVKGLLAYQAALGHAAIRDKKTKRITFDKNAMKRLMKAHPSDPLYPLIGRRLYLNKLRATYVGVRQENGSIKGGMPMGPDGLGHPTFRHDPSTLRLSCPFFHTLPRPGDPDEPHTWIRNLIIASPGNILLEADYAAIESVLTAYFAKWPDGIRLAKLGVHSYLASHVLDRPADLSWSDDDLRQYFKEIKGSKDAAVQRIYSASKRCVHGSNYGMTPSKMVQMEPGTFPTIKFAQRMQDIYFEVAAPVRAWHLQTQEEAHLKGSLTNPFGYRHQFNHVFKMEQDCGRWIRKPGDDANAVLAFLPQSTAAAIIKEAILRLYFRRFEEAGQYLRLQVHDSLLSDVPLDKLDQVLYVKREEMTRPIPELPLPENYNLGTHLIIDVSAKKGFSWGALE